MTGVVLLGLGLNTPLFTLAIGPVLTKLAGWRLPGAVTLPRVNLFGHDMAARRSRPIKRALVGPVLVNLLGIGFFLKVFA